MLRDQNIDDLASALEIVTSLDMAEVGTDELASAVLHAEQLLNAVHALSAGLIERFAREGDWATDGSLSAASWIAERTGTAKSSLRGRLRQGRAMTELPMFARTARSGRVSTEHLRAVSDCVHRHVNLAAAHDEQWRTQAETLHAEGFRLATRHWLDHAADLVGPDPSRDPLQPTGQVSRLHVSRTLEGWLRVDGTFTPDDAHLVEAVLEAGVDRALRSARNDDSSVAGQPVSALRAGAFVDLVAQAMRHEPSDASVPDRYRVAVVVQHGGGTVPAEAACDADAYRVVRGAQGRKAARRQWTTVLCFADATTASSTGTAGELRSKMVDQRCEDPMEHHTSSTAGISTAEPLELGHDFGPLVARTRRF